MQVYVQKSIRTTLPCRSLSVSGGVLSQPVLPASGGIGESMGTPESGVTAAFGWEAMFFGGTPPAARTTTASAACQDAISRPSAGQGTPTPGPGVVGVPEVLIADASRAAQISVEQAVSATVSIAIAVSAAQ